jgi:nicotinamidase-related amidase
MTAKLSLSDPEHTDIESVLLIVDMINDFSFSDGDKLFERTEPILENVAGLRQKAKASGAPVIYVNDNFGKWQENFKEQIKYVMDTSEKGAEVAKSLLPDDEDYHVLKPQRSGFYQTPLELLLSSMKVKRVLIAGITTDMCVLFTAHDAYMRGYEVSVPADCTAAVTREFEERSLELIERVADADIRSWRELELSIEKKGAHQ